MKASIYTTHGPPDVLQMFEPAKRLRIYGADDFWNLKTKAASFRNRACRLRCVSWKKGGKIHPVIRYSQ